MLSTKNYNDTLGDGRLRRRVENQSSKSLNDDGMPPSTTYKNVQRSTVRQGYDGWSIAVAVGKIRKRASSHEISCRVTCEVKLDAIALHALIRVLACNTATDRGTRRSRCMLCKSPVYHTTSTKNWPLWRIPKYPQI
jgi:hypothetical protein